MVDPIHDRNVSPLEEPKPEPSSLRHPDGRPLCHDLRKSRYILQRCQHPGLPTSRPWDHALKSSEWLCHPSSVSHPLLEHQQPRCREPNHILQVSIGCNRSQVIDRHNLNICAFGFSRTCTTNRPMRPKPFIAIRTVIITSTSFYIRHKTAD